MWLRDINNIMMHIDDDLDRILRIKNLILSIKSKYGDVSFEDSPYSLIKALYSTHQIKLIESLMEEDGIYAMDFNGISFLKHYTVKTKPYFGVDCKMTDYEANNTFNYSFSIGQFLSEVNSHRIITKEEYTRRVVSLELER